MSPSVELRSIISKWNQSFPTVQENSGLHTIPTAVLNSINEWEILGVSGGYESTLSGLMEIVISLELLVLFRFFAFFTLESHPFIITDDYCMRRK